MTNPVVIPEGFVIKTEGLVLLLMRENETEPHHSVFAAVWDDHPDAEDELIRRYWKSRQEIGGQRCNR